MSELEKFQKQIVDEVALLIDANVQLVIEACLASSDEVQAVSRIAPILEAFTEVVVEKTLHRQTQILADRLLNTYKVKQKSQHWLDKEEEDGKKASNGPQDLQ